ncbi:Hypothetical protein PHPALM_4465 [Phytophthora palmivora]|uniref:Peptidase A2 domain-containing protein n=1 Tax=Phytophthora palmivora TaxID=4796 RepID=A0A2P4YJR8_9STRA|nr:Hypothetical protein PHPALM_4465 [Phytophthora palmivora]
MGHSAHFCRRRCKFCKQVHEVGQCELFRRYEKLASFVKNNADKAKLPEGTPRSLHADPPTLTELEFSGLPQSAEPVVEANFVFVFVGEAGWPEGSVGTDEGMCISDGTERKSEESDEDDSVMASAAATRRYGSVTLRQRVVIWGERLGWLSSQKFDRRVQMRALILLDTGANVSAVSSTLARKLRLKQYASGDQQIDIQGIQDVDHP